MNAHIELLGGRVVVDSGALASRSLAAQQDVVILSGTLLEGFGNLYSDLDLYVIGDFLPTDIPERSTMLVVREDGCVRRVNEMLPGTETILLDVQYYTFHELETLARSLLSLYQESRLSTAIFRKTLHHDDEDLIHKLLTGIVLKDDTEIFDARRIFDPGMFCFLKYRNESGGYAEFRDLVGSWTAGDLDSCLYNTRAYLIAQVSGMMYLLGSTNPRPKWFVRKLASLGPEYAELREGIMLWMHQALRTELQKRKAIETACDLIDLTYAHVRRLLGTNPRYFTSEEACAITEHEFAERRMRDRETLAEWQLRRQMFSASEGPLMTQFRTQLVAAAQEDRYASATAIRSNDCV